LKNTPTGVNKGVVSYNGSFLHQFQSSRLEDGFTARNYIKVCAEETEPLVDWVSGNRQNGLTILRACGNCEAEVEEIGFYRHPEEAEPETHEEGSTATEEDLERAITMKEAGYKVEYGKLPPSRSKRGWKPISVVKSRRSEPSVTALLGPVMSAGRPTARST